MFALYYEQDDGRLTWIAACHDVRSARNMAQIYSAGSEQPVVCIFNDASGGTHRCGVFQSGREMMGSPYMDPSYHLPLSSMPSPKYSWAYAKNLAARGLAFAPGSPHLGPDTRDGGFFHSKIHNV